uniref:Uncharacterized protein n=1 Tax=Chlorobium phaeobacteroides (strain BS1) TaxID=331678 RepID=B3ELG3_CHLPB
MTLPAFFCKRDVYLILNKFTKGRKKGRTRTGNIPFSVIPEPDP